MSSVHGPRRSARISWTTVLLLFIVAAALLGSYSVIHRLQLGLEACKGRERAAQEKQHEEQKRLTVAREMMGGLTTAELAERSRKRYEAMLVPGLESTKWRPMLLRNCTIGEIAVLQQGRARLAPTGGRALVQQPPKPNQRLWGRMRDTSYQRGV